MYRLSEQVVWKPSSFRLLVLYVPRWLFKMTNITSKQSWGQRHFGRYL